MNDNIDNYKNLISETEDKLLETYKNQIINYENSRVLYEKIILEYDPASTNEVQLGFYGNAFITVTPYRGYKTV